MSYRPRSTSTGRGQMTPQQFQRGSVSTVKSSVVRSRQRSAGSRTSFIPSSSRRTAGSAIGGDASGKCLYGVAKLSDPAHMEECRQVILKMAEEHSKSVLTSEERLKKPTTEHFKYLFQVLYRFVIEDYKATDKGFENEVPKLLRDMKCPIDVKKSSVQAVGHSWPILLTALRWLVDVIQYGLDFNAETAVFPPDMDGDSVSVDMALFAFNAKYYGGYQLNRVDECDEACVEFERQVRSNDSQGLKELELAKERLLGEYDYYTNKKPEDELEREKREQIKQDTVKLEHEFSSLETYSKKQQARMQELQEEQNEQLKQMESLRNSIVAKKQRIGLQTIPCGDVQIMHLKKNELTEENNLITKQTEDTADKVDKMQIDCSKTTQEIKSMWLNLRSSLESISKNMEQTGYVLDLDKINPLDGTFPQASMKLQSYLNNGINQLQANKLRTITNKAEFKAQLDAELENVNDFKHALRDLEREKNEADRRFEQDKQARSEELNKLKNNLDFLQQEKATRDRSFISNDDCEVKQAELSGLRKQKDDLIKSCALELQEIHACNLHLVDLAIAQRTFQQMGVEDEGMMARVLVEDCTQRLMIDEEDVAEELDWL